MSNPPTIPTPPIIQDSRVIASPQFDLDSGFLTFLLFLTCFLIYFLFLLWFLVVLTTSSDCYKFNEIYKLFLPFIESQSKYLTSNNANNR